MTHPAFQRRPDLAVLSTTTARHADSGDKVRVVMSWQHFDPHAIVFKFVRASRPVVSWEWARELMVDAFAEPWKFVGMGDVAFQRTSEAELHVWLRSPSGSAHFEFDARDVEHFLSRSLHLCPLGQEYADLDIDEALADFLAEEAA